MKEGPVIVCKDTDTPTTISVHMKDCFEPADIVTSGLCIGGMMVHLEFGMRTSMPDCSGGAPVFKERAFATSWAPYFLSKKKDLLMSDEALNAF